MSILGTSTAGDDLEQQVLAEIRDAARNDWRAASWLLQHHPQTRERYSDFDAHQTMARQMLDQVMKAFTMTGLGPEWQIKFLTALQAVGLPTHEAEQ